MKLTVRIACVLVALVCLCATLASCGEKIPEDFDGMERGDRLDFSVDALAGCEHSYKIGKSNTNNLSIETKIDGFDANFEYINCKMEILFKCTVIYDDMTEEEIEKTFTIELGFEGDMTHTEGIETAKKVHSVFNETYEVVKVEGQIIKK